MSYSDSQPAILLETAVPGGVVAGRMVSSAFQRVEVAKVLHSRTASRMLQIQMKTRTMSPETFDIVEHCEVLYLYSSNVIFF